MTLEEIGPHAVEVAPAKYRIDPVPKPHSAFEMFIAMITPGNGLCWIKALSPVQQTNVFGGDLRAAFDSMETKLSASYGKSERTDVLITGSIWQDPQDWMQSMISRDRFLMTEWTPRHGTDLRDSLVSVALLASALDTHSGRISVEYSFENMKVAEAELAAAEDDAL